MKSRVPVKVYQIKVSLKNIHPPVWRRVLVSDNITLLDLHDVIQRLFEWVDYHLHQFAINNELYGDPLNDETGDLDLQDETRVKLRDLNLTAGSHFTYEYDFGDSWEHILVLEKILPFEKGMKLPQCIKGKRAGPPEDVGGPWGYERFLQAIRDPKTEEHENYLEWIGGEPFNAEALDLDAINERLRIPPGRGWLGTVPPTEDEIDQNPIFAPSRWAHLLNEENEKIAETVPLRRDVVSFLNYLKENKVVGTRSTGNLPLKALAEIAARFVNPPRLEIGSEDLVYPIRSEVEVPEIYFVHVLAQVADLISGGPGQRWGLTPRGEKFLAFPAVAQVMNLFYTWWYRVNWFFDHPTNLFGNELTMQFSSSVLMSLREMPVGQSIAFKTYLERLFQPILGTWTQDANNYASSTIHYAIEEIVIKPLEGFGVLVTRYERDTEFSYYRDMLTSISIKDFGHKLLETI